jgi:hypothetical protein
MTDEEARRLRAYQMWERDGRPEGEDLAHWYRAGTVEAAAGDDARYAQFAPGVAPAGSLVIKFYQSGDQVRGYVRKIADKAEEDAIFPGEEMEPQAAFTLAKSHHQDDNPIFVELTEGVAWDPSWGVIEPQSIEAVEPETDDARAADGPTAGSRRAKLAQEAKKGVDRAMGQVATLGNETATSPNQER